MSREAFEKGLSAVWLDGYHKGVAAQPKWIPYKAGDVVEDGNYLASLSCRDFVVDISHYDGKWIGDDSLWWIDNSYITAYMPLPAPYVPEVSND